MTKNLAIIITDLHLKEDNINIIKDLMLGVISAAYSRDLVHVFCTGDIFESRKAQTSKVLSAFEDILDLFQDNNMKLITCVGNHDKTNYRDDYSFLSPFRHHPGLMLIPISETFDLTPEISLSLLSYFEDDLYLQYLHALSENLPNKRRILLTHIGISGGKTNGKHTYESETLNAAAFSNYEMVLVGHFHDSYTFSKTIHYIGASLQHNYGENLEKGPIALILQEDGTIELDRIYLGTPQYLVHRINISDVDADAIWQLENLRNDSPNDFFRVVLEGSDADIKAFDKSVLMSKGIDVKTNADEVKREEIEANVYLFDSVGIKKQFEAFCSKSFLDEGVGNHYLNQIIK